MTIEISLRFNQAKFRRFSTRTLAVSLLLSFSIQPSQAEKQNDRQRVDQQPANTGAALPEKSNQSIALPRGVDPSRLAVHTFMTATVDKNGAVSKFTGSPAQQYSEDLGNGARLEMVAVKGGTFLMGSMNGNSEEKPQRQVTLGDLWMGKYEVTQAQWRAVMGTNPSDFKGGDLPVEQVSWDDAREFCRRLNAKFGLSEAEGYRLPSEAEWEYAARAGSRSEFAFGETVTPEIVNYDGNYPYGGAPKGINREKTVTVGSLGVANAWGLFDLHGNVQEWCEDDWHDSYQGAPVDGRAWVDISRRAPIRAVRGGHWYGAAMPCRSAFRYGNSPNQRIDYLGFRLCRTASVK
jgi:eukaryotic-like serine/threonine-protein kinase